MDVTQQFLRYCFLFLILFIFQSAGIFAWLGIHANLILLFFLFIGMHRGKRGETPLPSMLALGIFCIFFSLLFAQVSFLPILITVCIVCGAYELRKILTGDKFLDFLILIAISTFCFHIIFFGIHGAAHEGLITWQYFCETMCVFGKELLINLTLGVIGWFIYERIKRK
jgi:hypothetical protein